MLPGLNSIPDWNISGVLPASYEGDPVSPYEVSLLDVVSRFGISEERRRLLTGLLDFRAELHNAGLEQGFQWINGSFVENIEDIEDRPPGDIDVVTFFHTPDDHTQETLLQNFPDMFNHQQIKDTYYIDSYLVPLSQVSVEVIISRSVYWNNLWSHDRYDFRKGYLQVDLASREDTDARIQLGQLSSVDEQA